LGASGGLGGIDKNSEGLGGTDKNIPMTQYNG